jgi:hypothetical protein
LKFGVSGTYNLRGSDVDFNPTFYAFAIVTKDASTLYVDSSRLAAEVSGFVVNCTAVYYPGGWVGGGESAASFRSLFTVVTIVLSAHAPHRVGFKAHVLLMHHIVSRQSLLTVRRLLLCCLRNAHAYRAPQAKAALEGVHVEPYENARADVLAVTKALPKGVWLPAQ